MSVWELLMIAVGLSMDAFAVAVCKGLHMRRLSWRQTGAIALCFGGFQALMPFLGWLLGSGFAKYIESFDHWIAFGLLIFLGGRMIVEAIKGEDEASEVGGSLQLPDLLMLGVATSIDALAVGVAFAVLPDVNIAWSVLFIGVTTFVLSAIGVIVGNKCGDRVGSKAGIVGGVILCVIGIKILIEHLMG